MGLCLLLFTGAVAYWSANWSIDSFRSVKKTEQVLELLRSTLAAMLDIETGSRGFVITGKNEFLEPFDQGKARVIPLLAQLQSATRTDPAQQNQLRELDPLVNEKISTALSSIQLRQQGGIEPARYQSLINEDKDLMDSIRLVIGNMESLERTRMTRRSNAAEGTFKNTMAIVAASVIIASVLTGLAMVLAGKDFQRRRLAEEERDGFFIISRDPVCFANFDGFFTRVNPAWETVLGLSNAEMLAKPFVEFVHPEDREETLRQAARLVKGEEVVQFENRYQAADGSYHWLSWSARASISRRVIYATARDVTGQKMASEQIGRLNADLQQRAGQLEEANKELEAFSYSVSHDLRAPLRHIGGFVSQLEKASAATLDDKGKRYLKIIADSARQMGALIDDLLVFSRMSRTEMQHTRFNMRDLVTEVISSLETEIEGRKVVWKSGHLPEVEGDRPMLRQVLANLLSNAAKYTRPREIAEIEIAGSETADELIFHVRDNGVGFDMEYVGKLFGIFQRLHRADEFEGTGIGLANVRRIISRHGGRTWAEGRVNEGATFSFSLPKTKTNP
ncbi:MAG: CHASE3 domain-containing protein [Akkermansiaceae bacterium]|nr:CHASE3 domain-containing protein [Verrucomicrobiales bacterium]